MAGAAASKNAASRFLRRDSLVAFSVVMVAIFNVITLETTLRPHFNASSLATEAPTTPPHVSFNRSSYPGRFGRDHYPNISVAVQFTDNPDAKPYVATDCGPGLTCRFSDRGWHEVSWNNDVVTFPGSPERPNTIHVSLESPSFWGNWVPGERGGVRGQYAGLALADLRSDVPLTYLRPLGRGRSYSYPSMPNHWGDIEFIRRPMSDEIVVWRILHIASNCDYVSSDRKRWVEALMERGLLDSYGKCQRNRDWESAAHLLVNLTQGSNQKHALVRKYAFVTAFENSYYPGYITEKLIEPLSLGSLPIYLGAPNAVHLFPQKSFLSVDEFATYGDLADYVEDIIENRKEYYKYHEWRERDIPKHLQEIWKFAKQDDNCRLCRWGAENLHLRSHSADSLLERRSNGPSRSPVVPASARRRAKRGLLERRSNGPSRSPVVPAGARRRAKRGRRQA